jgi:hypothetical protein
VAAGNVPPSIVPLLTAGRGVGIPKNDKGELRPIVIGNVLLRLIGSAAVAKLSPDIATYFLKPKAIQFGVGVPAGCEIMAAAINAHLELHQDHVDISCDARNAFNSWCRSRLWEPLREKFPSLYAFTKLLYGQASDIIFHEDGQGLASIVNAVGSRQGCSLGSLLYCLAIHPLLLQLQSEFPELLILAYCDDVHIIGPPDRAIIAYRKWAGLYNSVLQGELRDDKGCVYSPTVNRETLHDLGLPTSVPPEPATPNKMPFTSEGLRVLGAPVGSQNFYESFSSDTTNTIIADFEILARMPTLQGQHIVATKALCHKINHLLRNVPGGEREYEGTATRYDDVILQVATRASGSLVLPELSKQIAEQPWSLGGMGYRTWHKYADGAYLSAYVHNSMMFPTLFPKLAHMFPDVRNLRTRARMDQPIAPSRASFYASRALARLLHKAPGVLEAVEPSSGLHPRQLQHTIALLTDAADDLRILERIHHLDNKTHPRNMAAFLSSKGDPHTMATTPFDSLTTLSNMQFKTVTQLKLLLPTTNTEDGPMQCPTCKQTSKTFLKGTLPPVPTVDSYSDHSTSCKEASGSLRTKLWHDPQVRVWFYLMRGAGFRCEREKEGIVVSSGKRPDIVIFGGGPTKDSTTEVWFDFRTCHPTCASNCKLAAVQPGYSARRGNELKDDAWVEIAAAQGSKFIPLTHEAFGRMGAPALDFINSMATNAGACPIERSAFVRITCQRIYTSNMKAVANMILANAPIAPGPRLLPLTMLAPIRRPMATPLASLTAADSAAPISALKEGPRGNPRRGQPAWISNFLRDEVEELPTPERRPHAAPPLFLILDPLLCAPR